MSNIGLLLEYDGTNYNGWQSQSIGRTIQQEIESATNTIFGVNAPVVASGRTDTGVHARGQVAHLILPETANNVPLANIAKAINSKLPRDIRVLSAETVAPDFHARFSAISREYVYRMSAHSSVFTRNYVWTPEVPYNYDMLSSALRLFEGTHNFTAISKNNPDTKSYECTVENCELEEHSDEFLIRIRANRFVYGMCRAILGTAMGVARNRLRMEDIPRLLASASRENQEPLAPPHGLYLNRVYYSTRIFENYFVNL